MKKILESLRSFGRSIIEARQDHADFVIANTLIKDYPVGTSLHDVVRDLKQKRGERAKN